MTLKDETLRTALMGAMATVVKDVNEAQRAKILAELVTIYKDTGNKSWEIALPSGDKVAQITLNSTTAEAVATNPAAFLAWCKENRPDLVETVEHPPVEGWTETRLSPAAVARVSKEYKLAGTDYITEDGEPVDGIEYKPAPDPVKFTLSYAAKDRGASVVASWREGFIPLALDSNLPQIGGTA